MVKTFPIKLTLDEHKEIQVAARKSGKSMIEFILEAIKDKIQKVG